MAEFCLATKVQPSEYRALTILELEEFIKAVNEQGPSIEDMF
jgi:hypothetical protein